MGNRTLISIQTRITELSFLFDEINPILEDMGFVISGNWDYKNGIFDKPLEEKEIYWIRLPFRVVVGRFDPAELSASAAGGMDVTIQFETPIVLHHERRTHPTPSNESQPLSGLFNQFQSPAVQDGNVSEQWVKRASEIMNELERKLSSQKK